MRATLASIVLVTAAACGAHAHAHAHAHDCDDVGAAFLRRADELAGPRDPASVAPARDAIVAACKTDGWSAEAAQCVADAKGPLTDCEARFSRAQLAGMTKAFAAAIETYGDAPPVGFVALADEPDTIVALAGDDRGVAWVTAGQTLVGKAAPGVIAYREGASATATIGPAAGALALDRDTIYWSGSGHVWRAPRAAPKPEAIADVDARQIVPDASGVYWMSDDTVGRVPAAGGASAVIAHVPADAGAAPGDARRFAGIAIAGGHVLALVQVGGDPGASAEVWRVDGAAPVRLSVSSGGVNHVAGDGDRIVWEAMVPDFEIRAQSSASGQPTVVAHGDLVDARAGAIYFQAKADVFVTALGAPPRRIARALTRARIAGDRMFGVSGHRVGYVLLAK